MRSIAAESLPDDAKANTPSEHGSSTTRQSIDLISSPISRAEITGQPFDVASSDRHTVKPCLAARATVSAEIADLSQQGSRLKGDASHAGAYRASHAQVSSDCPLGPYRHCRWF
jgi:anti-sigma factor RsiW